MRVRRGALFLTLSSCFLAATYGCGKSAPRAVEHGEEAGRSAYGGEAPGGGDTGSARGGSISSGGEGGAGASGGGGGSGAGAGAGSGGRPAGGGGGASGVPGMGAGGALSGASGMGRGGDAGSGASASGVGGSAGSAGVPIDVPVAWWCEAEFYADGTCDCGCDHRDPDCADASIEACERCPSTGCSDAECSAIFPDDNSVCGTAGAGWSCSERLYADGSQCDCGCGYTDPDCTENALAACDRCNAVGSCSGQACPGTIDPDSIERCVQPPAPEGWRCEADRYADGHSCDCGCGVPDLDCRANTAPSCEQCECPGICPDSLDPTDPTKCAPVPEGWACEPERWSDFDCDCGCGVPDYACGFHTPLYCVNCLGCTEGDCERLDPNDNSRCEP